MGCSCQLCTSILLLTTCILLFLLSAWYWYYFALGVSVEDYASIVLYLISALLLKVLGLLGIISILKHWINALFYFAIVNFVMFILGLLQVALTIYSATDCDNSNNPFTFICDLDTAEQWLYWAPTVMILVANILAFIFAMILKKVWQSNDDDDGNNFYL